MIEFTITAFIAMFVVIDPIGTAPLFTSMTQDMEQMQRRRVTMRACVIAAVVLVLFGLFGEALLGSIGISIPAFQIAGGILLFLTAIDMLFEKRAERRERRAVEQRDPSVFPLAIPLVAGPGSIATMILLVGQAKGDWKLIVIVHLVMACVVLLTFLTALATGLLGRFLGRTGITVLTKLFGMLLASLSVQFILDGLQNFRLVAKL